MTLFLSEHVAAAQAQSVSGVSLAEGTLALVELAEHFGNLNEALLVGDYALHERSKGLSEADQSAEKTGFFKKAAAHVKEFARKAKETLIRYYNIVKENVLKLLARVKNFIKPEMEVPKGALAGFDKIIAAVNKAIEATKSKEADAAAFTKHAQETVEAAKEVLATESQAIKKAKGAGEYETVKVSAVTKIQQGATVAMAASANAAAGLDQAIKLAEEAEKANGANEESTKKLALARAQSAAHKAVATLVGGVGSTVASIVSRVGAGEKKEDK